MQDVSSLSNINQFITTHAAISFQIDVSAKTIATSVDYTLHSQMDGLDTLIFDAKDLEIVRVSPCTSWTLGEPNQVLGAGLKVTLEKPLAQDEALLLSIECTTGEHCSALQFLEPSQTAGKVHPYCYTQNEPIHCRSLLPIQDSPSIKFTIQYVTKVAKPLKAVVAGLFQEEFTEGQLSVFKHHQPVPIPAYLIAFAVGDIHSHKIGPRSEVFAEPSVLEAAATEFALTEDQLQAAENLMTEYAWGTLNLLVLPPSFPYGGMENPNLIFVTPSLLAGDRSLVSVVAHEIAHSWTGNLVTNANWENFWLNEGFTVFFERKIAGLLFGRPLAHLAGINGVNTLRKAIDLFGETSNFTCLCPNLTGVHPDDAFSSIPYEKGCLFLTYLESLVGEAPFMQFLRDYVTTFQFKSLTSVDFQSFFIEKFPNAAEINWEEWLRGTGMPPYLGDFDMSLVSQVEQLADKWKSAEYQPQSSDIAGWQTGQTVLLLNKLNEAVQPHFLQAGDVYGLNSSKNADIFSAWALILIKLKASEYYPLVKSFLKSYGRMRYVRPLFKELVKQDLVNFAREVYEECRDFYHPTLLSLLDKDL